MRSIQKALRDSAGLVEQLAIKREELACVRVDSFGDSNVHLSPSGFIRVFNAMRVRRSTLKADVIDGDLHAEFKVRYTRFVCVVRKEEIDGWRERVGLQRPTLPEPNGIKRLNGGSVLLLPAPK